MTIVKKRSAAQADLFSASNGSKKTLMIIGAGNANDFREIISSR
jgi:hypothetical protein